MFLGLSRKSVLVTAASKGIGRAIAEEFASEGARVAICSRDKENLLKTSDDIKSKYGIDVLWCVCDLSKRKDVERTVSAVEKEFKSIDILINNCGGPKSGNFSDVDDSDWRDAVDQVLLSAVTATKFVLPKMIEKEWGRIINISSISVKQPIDNLILSNSVRSGLQGLTKSLSNEYGKFNITVNNVAPGYTLTNRVYEIAVNRAKELNVSHEEVLSDIAKEIPLNRLASAKEIASLVVFLASMKASYITGTTIPVDGGYIKGI
ncbi:MAG: 3-oxoacyl-ACP reductase [Ignavibacteriales bacterium CG12_big_fil_rev_8_21_14_0_65_30_8]|nr:MAG: 3-oxoacyl-ACP reductase [Ignavibacteriales bacterium CG12_big_fil_rev_8_21_14_0_65_30_8]